MYKETAKQKRYCANHTRSCLCPLNILQHSFHEIKAAQIKCAKIIFDSILYSLGLLINIQKCRNERNIFMCETFCLIFSSFKSNI